MTTQNVSTPEQTSAGQTDQSDDERARKRVAIGLAPRRPTAKAAPERPPDERTSALQRWWPVWLLLAVAAATLLLLAAKLLNSPTDWSPVRSNLTTWWAGQKSPNGDDNHRYRLQVTDDFDRPSQLLAAQQAAGQWWMNVVPKEGVYLLDVWPQHVAWSTLGVHTNAPFKVETAFALPLEAVDGYAGLLSRYQDQDNFYFFVINGKGQLQAQLRKEGVMYPLQPWIAVNVLKPPGENNVMALTDDGATLSLYLNDSLVYEVFDLQLPTGQSGILGGAAADALTKIKVDWLKLYEALP
ncbi:MAG: hypothetical protein U0350_48190 [Caldilineaceae bacterium]